MPPVLRHTAAVLLVCLLIPTAAAARAGTPSCDLSPALEAASKSVVQVRARLNAGKLPPKLEVSDGPCLNTGFFVGTDGEVLTSLVGVAGCEHISVLHPDGSRAQAEVVAMEQAAGLALLQSDFGDTAPLEPAPAPPREEELVLLAHVPEADALELQLSPGLVSGRSKEFRLRGIAWEGLMSVRAAAEPGTAGAPLLDVEGRLVGVVLAARSPGQRLPEGGCVALPLDRLQGVLSRLRGGESRRLGWLGVAIVAESGGLEGARIHNVLENSPAHQAGIRPGDVLLQVADHNVTDPEALGRWVAEAGPRRGVQVKLLRGDRMRTVQVDVGARPLLICGASRSRGEDRMRLRRARPGSGTPLEMPSREQLRRLMEENRRLRERLRSLERDARRRKN